MTTLYWTIWFGSKIEIICSHDCNIAIDAQVVKSAGYEEPIIIKKYKSPAVFIRLRKKLTRNKTWEKFF